MSVLRKHRVLANVADGEVLQRVDAARVVLDAVSTGRIYPDAEVLAGVSKVVAEASRWAKVAEADAA